MLKYPRLTLWLSFIICLLVAMEAVTCWIHQFNRLAYFTLTSMSWIIHYCRLSESRLTSHHCSTYNSTRLSHFSELSYSSRQSRHGRLFHSARHTGAALYPRSQIKSTTCEQNRTTVKSTFISIIPQLEERFSQLFLSHTLPCFFPDLLPVTEYSELKLFS